MSREDESDHDRIWRAESIDGYVEGRSLCENTTRKIVNEVLSKNLNPGMAALEIGSGLGELVRLAPDYASQIKQTDQSGEIVAAHRQRNPKSNINQVHAYDLPFADETFEMVIGYASFDTIPNIGLAVKEMSRVLEPGGMILHFLDLQASANTVFFNLKREIPDKVPFPVCDDYGRSIGVRLLDAMAIGRLKQAMPPLAHQLIDLYIQGPEEMWTIMTERPEIMSDLADRVAAAEPGADKISFNDYFVKRIQKALEDNGLTNIVVRKAEASEVVDRDSRFSRMKPTTNNLVRDVGLDLGGNDPQLPAGKIRITQHMLVVEAKKQPMASQS